MRALPTLTGTNSNTPARSLDLIAPHTRAYSCNADMCVHHALLFRGDARCFGDTGKAAVSVIVLTMITGVRNRCRYILDANGTSERTEKEHWGSMIC